MEKDKQALKDRIRREFSDLPADVQHEIVEFLEFAIRYRQLT